MMVLDTNVLSELMRPAPDDRVVEWLRRLAAASLYTTAITRAELLFGVALLPAGKRQRELAAAVQGMLDEDFRDRVLPFDTAASDCFAQVALPSRRRGRPMSDADARIAAIVASRGARLATRNRADFDACGIEVVNPWESTRKRR